MTLRVLTLVVLLVPAHISVAVAEERFSAILGPRPTVTTSASGRAELTLDESETQIEFDIRVQGLESPELAAHLHVPGGEIAFQLPLGEHKFGVWSNPGFTNVLLLRTGQLYILVHTEDNPGGELRGDLRPGGLVATGRSSWGRVKALFEP